ncbi:MAG TPA: protein kinase, partial [Kofleriaceae bacterium]|nr:protein kinase [Kofleriaceae bacterium]
MSDVPREEVGPYLVYEQIGAGGMATVHRAEQRGFAGFRRVVALKRLHANVAADPELLRSFVHEARLASYLRHTNVAQTFDLGKVDDTYFIAMEFVPGPTLGQLMRQCTAAAGQIPLPIVLSIVIQICDALDHAHNLCDDAGKPLGIIHRDVSPSNVIVSNTGIVKLIDFGIAKAAGSNVHTQTGMIKGKFGYIAPEYLTGQLDARSDLFGVGVIIHELLAGRPLFLGRNDFETLSRLREMPIPPPSRFNASVTPDLEDIVMTALQRDPDLRWQSAGAMRTALHNVLRDLNFVIVNQQIYDWVEWAFSQLPQTESTALLRAIDALDAPSVLIDIQPPAPAGAADRAADPFAATAAAPTVAERDAAAPPPRIAEPAPRSPRARSLKPTPAMKPMARSTPSSVATPEVPPDAPPARSSRPSLSP